MIPGSHGVTGPAPRLAEHARVSAAPAGTDACPYRDPVRSCSASDSVCTAASSNSRSTTSVASPSTRQGRHDQASSHLTQAYEIARAIGDRTIELGALTGLGHVHRLRGDCAQATGDFRQALSVARAIGSRNWQFESFHGLGRVHHATGRSAAALACHQQALQIAMDLGQPEDQARAHNGLAHARLAQNQPELARGHWQVALEILTRLGNDHSEDGEATAPAILADLARLDRDASAGRPAFRSVEP